jgi:integration host factor subunit alpha
VPTLEEKNMTKADIVESIYQRIGGISKKESADLLEKLLILIKATIKKGENLKVTGFGHFIVKDKKARKGINPQTKKHIILPRHRVLKLRVSQVLRGGINNNSTELEDGIKTETA